MKMVRAAARGCCSNRLAVLCGLPLLWLSPVLMADPAPNAGSVSPAAAASGPAGSADQAPAQAAPAPEATVATIPIDQHTQGTAQYTNIGAIVVTAQKRKEKLQDVPLAVSVVNEEQLRAQNITQVDQLSRAIPSIEQNGEPGNPETVMSIRGISTFTFSPTAEQAVSYVADGVVLGKAPTVNLFDVSRIEVLRGPQGTLFGKNASAGVVNVITNAPDPKKFEMIGHADVGLKYGKRLLQAVMNVPLSSDAAFRLSVGQTREDGLIHNIPRHEDSMAVVNGARGRFLWNITPDLTLNLIGDYEKSDTTNLIYFIFSKYDSASTGQPVPIPGCGGAIASYGARIACNNDPTFAKQGSWGLSAQLDWRIGDYTVTSITAGRRYTQVAPVDPDGLPQDYVTNENIYDNKTFSQELRIASPTGQTLETVAGIYYSKTNVPNLYNQANGADLLDSLGEAYGIPLAPCGQLSICLNNAVEQVTNSQYIVYLKSAAIFGQETLHVTDRLRLIAGARLTRDVTSMSSNSVQTFSSSVPGVGSLLNLIPPIQAGAPAATDKVGNVSWRGGVQYDFSKRLMAYATASHGYKGPQLVFNAPNDLPVNGGPAPASITTVNPEYPMDYEAGFKATLLRGAFALNFNAFHTMIKGFQSFNYTLQGAIPDNIPHVITEGAELDLLGMLGPGLLLNGGLIYDRATYPGGYQTECQQLGPQCPNTKTLENIGGTQLVAAPRFKFTLTPGYERDLNERMSAFVLADVVYKTDIHYEPYTSTDDHTGNHAVIGLRLGIRDPDLKWSVAVFGRNIFNAYNPAFIYAPYLLSQETAPGIHAVGDSVTDESFRFIGLSFDGRF
ncbi:MAG: TonB-dependent receptor [Nevskia sp.]|nr:TonB-dependent receptor [Nevskia sp.]